jgi:hypothetical protein
VVSHDIIALNSSVTNLRHVKRSQGSTFRRPSPISPGIQQLKIKELKIDCSNESPSIKKFQPSSPIKRSPKKRELANPDGMQVRGQSALQ